MANKQNIPDTRMGGVNLLKTASANETPIAKRADDGYDPTIDLLSVGLQTGAAALAFKKKLDAEQMGMETDQVLGGYRAQLMASQSENEFDTIAKVAEADLKNRFVDRSNGKQFWAEHGSKILEANRADVAKLKQMKDVEFGRQSFNQVLAANHNLLARTAGTKGETLIARAVDEIEKTPFLSSEEKNQYRDGYLKTGILNLALNDPERAMTLGKKYLPDDEALFERISETKNLLQQVDKQKKENQKRKEEIASFNRAFSIWQAREKGDISAAEFYVLTAENDPKLLWGDAKQHSQTPLFDAYRVIKKINGGEKLSAEEVKTAGNSFIAAYKQKKLSLDAVGEMHNQLMLSLGDKNVSGLLFDSEVDQLADDVLLPDFEPTYQGDFKNDLMEQKAKLAFDIYESYYSKKTALADEFVEQGGQITPMLERRFSKQALQETREELGLKDNADGELNFADLKRVMRNAYTGNNQADVWMKFYQKAPYVEDKKALLKQIALAEQRKELSYPQFTTLDEVQNAHLERGEKFYYKGRLAVKA